MEQDAARQKKHRWKHLRHWLFDTWLSYAGMALAVYLVDALPLSLARWFGKWGGRLVFHFDGRHRATSLENLGIAFPEKSESERLQILRNCYAHLGLCAVDFCKLKSLSSEELCQTWIVPEDGAHERLRTALQGGHGVIGVSGHVGFWELGGLAFPAMGYPLVSIGRAIPAPRVDALISKIRNRFGNTIVPQEGALRQLYRALKQNKVVGLSVDQYAGRDGRWLPFFGREASTLDSCAQLHLLSGAPLMCHLMIRRSDGRYTWRSRNIAIPASPSDNQEQRVRQVMLACNQELESAIREHPEQWLWMHKRWKSHATERRQAHAASRQEVELAPGKPLAELAPEAQRR